jgi:hypothetical protein
MNERVKKLVAGNAALTRLLDAHLLGPIEPDDVAMTALYLAGDESRKVTRQILPVDIGVTISRCNRTGAVEPPFHHLEFRSPTFLAAAAFPAAEIAPLRSAGLIDRQFSHLSR